jgi:hypothetical protein
VKVFVAGLLLGLAGGWVIAAVVGATDDSRGEAVSPRVPDATAPPQPPVQGDDATKPRPRPGPAAPRPVRADDETAQTAAADRAARIMAADCGALRRFDPPFSVPEFEAIVERLDRARAGHDRELFHRALALVVADGSPTATAKIVDVVGDPATDLDPWVACAMPRRSDAAGAAFVAAVRRRFEAEAVFASGRPDQWLEVVARHGDAGDLGWLESKAREEEFGEAARTALVSTRRDELAPTVAAWLGRGSLRGDDLEHYAKTSPATAFKLFGDVIVVGAATGRWPSACEPWQVFRAYARAMPMEALDDVRRLLLGLPTRELRADAIAAVQALAGRDVDPTPFAALSAAPVHILDDPAATWRQVAHTAWLAGAERVAWSLPLADAMERAADRFSAEEYAATIRRRARRIRAELTGPWAGK